MEPENREKWIPRTIKLTQKGWNRVLTKGRNWNDGMRNIVANLSDEPISELTFQEKLLIKANLTNEEVYRLLKSDPSYAKQIWKKHPENREIIQNLADPDHPLYNQIIAESLKNEFEIETTEKTLQKMKSEITKIQSNLAVIDKENRELENKNVDLNTENQRLIEEIEIAKNEIKNLSGIEERDQIKKTMGDIKGFFVRIIDHNDAQARLLNKILIQPDDAVKIKGLMEEIESMQNLMSKKISEDDLNKLKSDLDREIDVVKKEMEAVRSLNVEKNLEYIINKSEEGLKINPRSEITQIGMNHIRSLFEDIEDKSQFILQKIGKVKSNKYTDNEEIDTQQISEPKEYPEELPPVVDPFVAIRELNNTLDIDKKVKKKGLFRRQS